MTRALEIALSFAVLAAMFMPLERLFPARRQRVLRPRLAVDACYFLGQYVAWSALSLAILVAVKRACDAHVPGLWRDRFAAQPFALRALAAVALGDLLVYGWHRACHASRFLWRFHAVHHSAEQLDWLAAHREHPLDGVTTQLAQNLPAFALGFPLETVAALAAFRGAWGVFIHSNVRLPLGPLRFLVGAPELHHWHHARAARHNFANLAPWIDVLFGTYHRPAGPETYALGLDEPFPRGYVAQLVYPLCSRRAWRALSWIFSDRRRQAASVSSESSESSSSQSSQSSESSQSESRARAA
jgi:sterol desaturase/sphingolipid hydroxylase (fatty acid hydroxylase superfamily)